VIEYMTSRFGLISIKDEQCIDFPYGLPGFDQHRKFALLDSVQPPYYWLQSLNNPDIAFVLVDPFLIREDYNPDIRDEDLDILKIKNFENVLAMAIVTIRENPEETSVNLQGPVLINKDIRSGMQCIAGNSIWHVRHRLIEEMKKGRSGAC